MHFTPVLCLLLDFSVLSFSTSLVSSWEIRLAGNSPLNFPIFIGPFPLIIIIIMVIIIKLVFPQIHFTPVLCLLLVFSELSFSTW